MKDKENSLTSKINLGISTEEENRIRREISMSQQMATASMEMQANRMREEIRRELSKMEAQKNRHITPSYERFGTSRDQVFEVIDGISCIEDNKRYFDEDRTEAVILSNLCETFGIPYKIASDCFKDYCDCRAKANVLIDELSPQEDKSDMMMGTMGTDSTDG